MSVVRLSTRPAVVGGRPRVAILSTWHPEPVDNGRKQRTRELIRALSPAFDIVLISMLPRGESTRACIPTVPDVWRQYVVSLPVFQPRSPIALAQTFRPMPRSLASTWSHKTASRVSAICADDRTVLAIGTDLRTLRYLLALPSDIATILDEPDVTGVACRLHAHAGRLDVRASLRRAKYRHVLQSAARKLDLVIVASSVELEAYCTLAETDRANTVPNGIYILPECSWRVPDTHQLLYTGSIAYSPNAEAVAFFTEQVLPRLLESDPDVSLAVTGTLPPIIPRFQRHERIRLTGRLDSLDDIMRASRIFVAPILSGTGTRIKLLEAMALGMPIVSTTKGAEGLDVHDGEHLVLADAPDDFAHAISQLIGDPKESERLGRNARALVESRYLWSDIGQQLRTLVEAVLVRRSSDVARQGDVRASESSIGFRSIH